MVCYKAVVFTSLSLLLSASLGFLIVWYKVISSSVLCLRIMFVFSVFCFWLLRVREFSKRSRLKVSWSLLAGSHRSPLRVERSWLYAFSLIRGVVLGEVIDNINFLLIWISIINSASSTCCIFHTRFPLTLTLFCSLHFQCLISFHLHPKKTNLFLFSRWCQ